MPYNLLLLPLIGGFLFLHIAHYFRFGAQRLDGYRLLFQSAIAGILLSALARLSIIALGMVAIGRNLGSWWSFFSPFDYSGTSAEALLLGPLAALIVNLFIDKDKARDLEIRRHGSALQLLLHEAELNEKLVSVTLDSRKWYAGMVTESPNLDPQELYFRLLPFYSGYRDKDTLVIRRSVSYKDVLRDPEIESNEFVITIPIKDVKLASFFSEEVDSSQFGPQSGGASSG